MCVRSCLLCVFPFSGSLSFGSVDPRIAASTKERPAVIPLVSTKYWEVAIIGIKVNDQYLQMCSLDPEAGEVNVDIKNAQTDSLTSYCPAAIDTGSSLITVRASVHTVIDVTRNPPFIQR
eukprot:Protomagalhaensia_wolfi_Nauph_80__714@NODE_1408_length_1543_cov_146_993351_g251_i3_p2_GENE_NODE_1408_length_1543_cov_146_993351_g251_i3NODE_1408_length_1543_cov_146_993351_g251_i3_p2_ORF_typecomplete_len120_score22_09Asp/PF00026_23/4_1e08_NODE_1408_length_1543_cov_146_993351_g251_i310331392